MSDNRLFQVEIEHDCLKLMSKISELVKEYKAEIIEHSAAFWINENKEFRIELIIKKEEIKMFNKKQSKVIEKVKCQDIKCGSYSECDKIHCHQFYEYTEDGIIKREE